MKTRIFYSLKSIKTVLKETNPSKVCIVTSGRLAQKLGWAIKEIGVSKPHIILIPDGEKAKSWKELEKLLKKFGEIGLDRKSAVIALGGGTVGDTVGFAASIYLRGIRYIQVPTTLLAQVDSAHGGKTGINFLKYKNQIGSFHLPVAIIVDHRFIKSLSEEYVIDGLGEIMKAGFIKDPSILGLLKKHDLGSLVRSRDLPTIIKKSVAVKNYFTAGDFKDNGSRQILNVGHTVGHAIELKYKISHGRAVIIGMLQEFKIAESLGLAPASVRKSFEDLLARLGIRPGTGMKADWKTLSRDKKICGKTIDFPIVVSEGKATLMKLDMGLLKRALR